MTGPTNGAASGGGGGSGSNNTFHAYCQTAANESTKQVIVATGDFEKREGNILVIHFVYGNTSSIINLKIGNSTTTDTVIYQTSAYPGNYVNIEPNDYVTLVYIGGDIWSITASSSGSTSGGGATSLGQLSDVSSDSISGATTGQVLTKLAGGLWGAASPSGGSITYTKPWYVDTNGVVQEKNTIQEAIDECPVHGTVHIPWRGTTYYVSSTIHVPKPITIESDYNGYDHDELIGYNANYYQASSYTSAANKITNAQISTPLITSTVSDSSAAAVGIYIHCLGVTLRNISIQCTNFTRYESAVIKAKNEFGFATATTRSNFNRFITFENCVAICYVAHYTNNQNDGTYCGRGFWLDSTGLTRVLRCEVYGTHNAFYVTGNATVNTSILFQNCWAINFTSIGYYLYAAYYCTFISCAADSHAGNFGTDVTIGYYFASCCGISAVGCGAEKMTIGVALDSCYNVSFGGTITISKEGTSAQPTIGVQAFTTSKFGLENLFVLISTDAQTGQAITHYYKCVKNAQSKIAFVNTNIESVYNGAQSASLSNNGMFDFS